MKLKMQILLEDGGTLDTVVILDEGALKLSPSEIAYGYLTPAMNALRAMARRAEERKKGQ